MKNFVISMAGLQVVCCAIMLAMLLPVACNDNPVDPGSAGDQPAELPEVLVWTNSGNLSWTFEDPYSDCFINFRYRSVAIGDTVYSAVTGQPAIVAEIAQ